jgi:hypothetical protein
MAQAASISFLDIFKNVEFVQTGNGNMLSNNGGFFSADLNSTVGNAYTSAELSYPGVGSPISNILPQGTPPTDYHYQTSTFSTKALMDAAFPTGTYTFIGFYDATMDRARLMYAFDDYALTNPYLTGTDYTSLQGMNPSQAFTFHLSPDNPGNTAANSYIFFSIFDITANMFVFNQGFLAPTTTTIVLPANTLDFGHSFSYEVDFSNRDLVPSPGATNPAQPSFDLRTDGDFTTRAAALAPEPSTVALLGLGLLAVAGLRRRKA